LLNLMNSRCNTRVRARAGKMPYFTTVKAGALGRVGSQALSRCRA
jgi:hypothetical protein